MSAESAELEEVISVYKRFVRAVLIARSPDQFLPLLADDMIGMGMGAQGVVTSKADAERILCANKTLDGADCSTEVEHGTTLARCYDGRFATVCGVLKITTTEGGNAVTSTLGQLANFYKRDGQWLIVCLQATPIFDQIEELEAYPIKFAENVLETYRQQEQIAKNAYQDSIGVYLVNFTQGVFESSEIKSNLLVSAQKGDLYEPLLFESARKRLDTEECYRFISTFSLGNVQNAYQSGQTELSLEYRMQPPCQAPRWMKTVIKLYTDKPDETLKGYLYVIDINETKTRELALQSMTEQDSLTGLYNRGYAERRIAERLSATTPDKRGVFFMIDLDYFKNINDSFGHQEGDRILQETARCMLSLTRQNDIAGRLGGDEFCIYFQGSLTEETIVQRAQSLCDTVRGLLPTATPPLSCSIGITLCDTAGLSFQTVYQRADLALYRQKRNGRNGYTIYRD